ncbi:MAG: hypothetical protein WCK89_21075, partial [bacterium]
MATQCRISRITCCALCIVALAHATYAGIEVVYKGLDNTHVVYSNQITHPGVVTVKLFVTKPDATEEELVAQAVSPPMWFIGILHHQNLTQRGQYRYEAREYTNSSFWYAGGSASATLNSHIQGRLLYNETVSPASLGIATVTVDNVSGRGVTVEEGRTLTLSEGMYEGISGAGIVVSGLFSIAATATAPNLPVYFYVPHSIGENNRTHLIFKPGSEGSSVSMGRFSLVRSESDVKVSYSTGITAYVYSHGKITIADSQVSYLGFTATLSNPIYDFEVHVTRSILCYVWAGFFTGQWTFVVEDSRIPGTIQVGDCPTAAVQVRHCSVGGDVYIEGNAPVIEQCDLAGFVYMNARSSAVLKDNVILGQLFFSNDASWSNAVSPNADISGNSFVGQTAIGYWLGFMPKSPVPIGANYYGDESGPYGSPDFLLGRGGAIGPTQLFTVATSLATGRQWIDKSVAPKFWWCGWTLGQNVLPHDGADAIKIQGRETLLCVDLATTHEKIDGVKAFVSFMGQTVHATAGEKVTVYRDTARLGGRRRLAQNTLNFILPAVFTNGPVALSLWLDTTSLPGYPPGTSNKMMGATLYLSPPPKRQFHAAFVPLTLHLPGWCLGDPALQPLQNNVRNIMAAKLPIRLQDLHCYGPKAPLNYYGLFGTVSLTYLLRDIALWLRGSMAFVNAVGYFGNAVVADKMCAIMPETSMGGADGANLRLARDIVFAEGSPNGADAAVHELGHAIGLYTAWSEQYDTYPPFGIAATGITTFIPEPIKLAGYPGDRWRISHQPLPAVSWYDGNYLFSDIMGAASRQTPLSYWPIAETLAAFHDYFQGLKPATKSAVRAPAGNGRRIFVRAACERNQYGGLRLKKETMRAFDITDIPFATLALSNGPPYNEFNVLNAYDARGATVLTEQFGIGPVETNESCNGYWHWVFNLPTSTVRWVIHRSYNSEILLEV